MVWLFCASLFQRFVKSPTTCKAQGPRLIGSDCTYSMHQSCLMDMNLLGSGVKAGVGVSWGGNLSVAPSKQAILICHAMVENGIFFP